MTSLLSVKCLLNRDLSIKIGLLLQSVASVLKQVQHHLLKLDFIGTDARQGVFQRQLDRDAARRAIGCINEMTSSIALFTSKFETEVGVRFTRLRRRRIISLARNACSEIVATGCPQVFGWGRSF